MGLINRARLSVTLNLYEATIQHVIHLSASGVTATPWGVDACQHIAALLKRHQVRRIAFNKQTK